MATSREENPLLVDQFVAVTGATRAIAISMLEACAGNLELAVDMHMDGQGVSGASSSLQAEPVIPSAAGSFDQEEGPAVRAPIPQKTEVLVEDDDSKFASWRMRRPRRTARSVFDGFRDFQTEAKNYEDNLHGKSASKKRNLEDLFRPPVDVTHKGTFQSARDLGSSTNQWLLVNVQNVQEFECQTLNRDVWSCQSVKKLITDSFIFWQVYNDSAEGKRFMQFYRVTEWPFVAILDPFTGENQITWHKIPDGKTFLDLANDFLSMHPTPNRIDADQPPTPKRARREPSIVDASEQDQMEAAIQASLRDHEVKSKSPLYVIDSDSESDIIQDFEDEDLEALSDSNNIVESTPTKNNKTSSSSSLLQHRKSKASSIGLPPSSKSSSPLSTSSSQYSSSILSHPKNRRLPANNHKKDILSKCKNLSTSTKTTCSYSPLSLSSDSCRSTGSSSAGLWDHSLTPDTAEGGRDGEACTLSSSPCSSHTSDVVGQTDGMPSIADIDWKQYWGDESDPMSKIMMRFPDNRREHIELPCSSSLKALKVYSASMGFTEEKYELVTNFPRRQLSEMEDRKSLKDAGLHPQDTVFVQEL